MALPQHWPSLGDTRVQKLQHHLHELDRSLVRSKSNGNGAELAPLLQQCVECLMRRYAPVKANSRTGVSLRERWVLAGSVHISRCALPRKGAPACTDGSAISAQAVWPVPA